MAKLNFPDPSVTNPWQDPNDKWWEYDGDGWLPMGSSSSGVNAMAAKIFSPVESGVLLGFIPLPTVDGERITWVRETSMYGDPSFASMSGSDIVINQAGVYDFQFMHNLVQGDSANGYSGRTKTATAIHVPGWWWSEILNDPTQYESDLSSGDIAGNPHVLISGGGWYMNAGDIASVSRSSDKLVPASYQNNRDALYVRKLS